MSSESASSASSPTTDAAFRTLALRLLSTYHPQYGGAVPQNVVHVLPNELAPTFPAEVPLPGASRLVGSILSGQDVTAVLDCDLSLEQLYDFYAERLPTEEWTRVGRMRRWMAGFVSPRIHTQPDVRTGLGHIEGPFGRFGTLHVEYRRATDQTSLHISATVREADSPNVELTEHGAHSAQGGPETADVQLTLVRPEPSHPFHQRMGEWQVPAFLPVLSPPPGANQQEEGGGYSAGVNLRSSATLYAHSYDVAAVGRHYDTQLAAVGWAKESVETSASLYRTTWTLTESDGASWSALFFAVGLPGAGDRYALSFRADKVLHSPHSMQAQGIAMGYSSSIILSSGREPLTPS